MPAHAAPPRPDVLLRHRPAARGRCGRPSTRSTASCAARTRSSTGPIARRQARAARGPRCLAGRARARPGRGALRAPRDRGARRRRPAPRHARSQLLGPVTWTRCESTATSRCACARRSSSTLHGRQRGDRRAGHGAAARRAGGPEAVARLGVAFQLTNLIRDVPRGLGYGPRLPARPATRTTCAPARRPTALREHVAQQVARARELFAETAGVARRGCCPADAPGRARRARRLHRVLDRVERHGYDVAHARGGLRPWETARGVSPARSRRDRRARRRRGEERTSLDGTRADVLICGASFAGLAVARELAGDRRRGARRRPLRDRRARRRRRAPCPTPWLHAMGVGEARSARSCRHMTFTTPHGTRPLPAAVVAGRRSTTATLCERLWDAVRRRALRDGEGRRARRASRRRHRRAHRSRRRCARRSSSTRSAGGACSSEPALPAARRAAQPRPGGASGATTARVTRSTSGSSASLVRRGYGWRVPAGGEARIGVGSYDPRQHVQRADRRARRAPRRATPVRYQGNWFPHRLRAAGEDGVFFVGDSAGHCFPLSGEGIRTAFYFGIAAGREMRAVLDGRQAARARAAPTTRRSATRHAPRLSASRCASSGSIPALPPRVLTLALRA